MVGMLVWLSVGAGLVYLVWMTAMAGERYDLVRPRFFLWSAPGMVIQGGIVTYLLGRFLLVFPTIFLLFSAVRTIRIERKRGEAQPFVSTLQLWPLELAVLLVVAGVEYALTTLLFGLVS